MVRTTVWYIHMVQLPLPVIIGAIGEPSQMNRAVRHVSPIRGLDGDYRQLWSGKVPRVILHS